MRVHSFIEFAIILQYPQWFVKKNPGSAEAKPGNFVKSDNQEELDQEQSGNDVGQNADFLELTGEDLDHGVRD